VSGDWLAARLPPWQPSAGDRLRIALRGGAAVAVIGAGLALLLLLRLAERPLFGPARPWTPRITWGVCRAVLVLVGLRLLRRGQPMATPGAHVANHGSWMDILALNACDRLTFVAKAEVAGWAGVGWLARATGTLFIARKGTEARVQADLFEARLKAGHRLCFFPEGTSTDSLRVLPFKPTLFAAFFAEGLRQALWVQPVSVVWQAPAGADARLYGWWGDMDFAGHLLRVLAQPRQGRVVVTFHPPLRVADFADRKALAAAAEAAVRAGHAAGSEAGAPPRTPGVFGQR
jgi:1-acyl-sn-glycerol-3-phosphate acyltransferase